MAALVVAYDGASVAAGSECRLGSAVVPRAGAFRAAIRDPRLFRLCLLALGDVVRANYEAIDFEEWLASVLDPVVGIHPDGISFEGFSQDGSALGWVHFGEGVFGAPQVHEAGCTNIDYSEGLHRWLTSMTAASAATLTIGHAEGVGLEGGAGRHVEKRIDLPDGWVRGFGEMHAALAAADVHVPLAKADLANILRAMARKAPMAMKGRGLVFDIKPGEKARVIVEPWNTVVRLQADAPDVAEPLAVKVYGRRRLELLEKLIPFVQSARVHLCGDSRPSFWELQMGGARFVLALSSWTNRKFTASFVESLRGPAALVDDATVRRAAELLCDAQLLAREEMAEALGIGEQQAVGVAMALCRHGLAVCEPSSGALRWRPIRHLPFAEIGAAGDASSREENAARLLDEGKLEVLERGEREGLRVARGRCQGSAGIYDLALALAADGSFASASCTCKWMTRQGQDLKGGPCKHLLALRAAVAVRATDEAKTEDNTTTK